MTSHSVWHDGQPPRWVASSAVQIDRPSATAGIRSDSQLHSLIEPAPSAVSAHGGSGLGLRPEWSQAPRRFPRKDFLPESEAETLRAVSVGGRRLPAGYIPPLPLQPEPSEHLAGLKPALHRATASGAPSGSGSDRATGC